MIFRLSEKLGIPKKRIIHLNSKMEKTKERRKHEQLNKKIRSLLVLQSFTTARKSCNIVLTY